MTLVCRFELQKLIGHTLADAKLRQVASLAQRLLNLQPLNKMSAISFESNLNADEDLEFGADLFFQAPARFLVDVSLDEGDMMDFESTVPLEFHNEQYGHTSAADHSIVDGEKFNLAWIRDACDKIVRNCNSQLSQDELAMAICRVLNSEKPGEEVYCLVSVFLTYLNITTVFCFVETYNFFSFLEDSWRSVGSCW